MISVHLHLLCYYWYYFVFLYFIFYKTTSHKTKQHHNSQERNMYLMSYPPEVRRNLWQFIPYRGWVFHAERDFYHQSGRISIVCWHWLSIFEAILHFWHSDASSETCGGEDSTCNLIRANLRFRRNIISVSIENRTSIWSIHHRHHYYQNSGRTLLFSFKNLCFICCAKEFFHSSIFHFRRHLRTQIFIYEIIWVKCVEKVTKVRNW